VTSLADDGSPGTLRDVIGSAPPGTTIVTDRFGNRSRSKKLNFLLLP
jgi:hypothetical protein